MTQSAVPPDFAAAREQFLALVADLRPELHRYCARLVGSAIDGEDVVQESLAKAFYALSQAPELPPLRPWLFRIAHNTSLDFLRRYERRHVEQVAELPDVAPIDAPADPDVTRAALSSFLALPVSQRSAVILKDVLDHSLEQIAEELATTVQAVKALLVRGRENLRARSRVEPTAWRDRPETTAAERALLDKYVHLFNSREWDGLRELLLEEVRLDLVSKSQRKGKAVGLYFTKWAEDSRARLAVGQADGRAVLGVFRGETERPDSILLIDWEGEHIAMIRDFRYVPYLASAIEWSAGPDRSR